MKRKPYLQVELEVLDLLDPIATLAGQRPGDVILGLLRLWKWCWMNGRDVAPEAVVEGFLPGALVALRAFGFAQDAEDSDGKRGVIVRGADRYGKVRAAKVRGAMAANDARRRTTQKDADGTQNAPNGAVCVTSAPRDIERSRDRDLDHHLDPSSKDEGGAPTRKARQPSRWEALWTQMIELRTERLVSLGLAELALPQTIKPSRLNQLLSGAATWAHERLNPGVSSKDADLDGCAATLAALWKRYLWSSYWATRQPPFPLEGFCSRPVLERLDGLWGTDADPELRKQVWS